MANYISLHHFLNEFRSSIALFEFVRQYNGGVPLSIGSPLMSIDWQMAAARNAGLCLYHFGCAIDALKRQLPTAPVLKAVVEFKSLRALKKRFDSEFRNVSNVRHAIAHAGELLKNPYEMGRNSVFTWHAPKGASIGLAGVLMGELHEDVFSIGYHGAVFSLEVSSASAMRLESFVIEATAAFERAMLTLDAAPKIIS